MQFKNSDFVLVQILGREMSSSSTALSGAAKRKKRKLQAKRNDAELKKIPKISKFLLRVRPEQDSTNEGNDLDLLLDGDQGIM